MKHLRILGLLDELTYSGLSLENSVDIFPFSKNIFLNKLYRPDIIIVESAWFGYKNRWKHKLVDFNEKPAILDDLVKTLEWAQSKKIPCIFWNKEDPIHFEKFSRCASHFNVIATTDSECINKYPDTAKRLYLPFAIQPKIHYPSKTNFELKLKNTLFLGSYLKNNHPERKKWQDKYFPIFSEYGLDIYDRNSKLKNNNYKFPDLKNTQIYPSVDYKETGNIFRKYINTVNVNTITESPTMISRRFLESVACGCITFTNHSAAIDSLFPGTGIIIKNENDLRLHLENIKNNNLSNYIDRLLHSSELVLENYSYKNWLNVIFNNI